MRTSKTPESEKPPEETSAAHSQSNTAVPTAPLPEHISQNIETIVALHARNERDVSRHRRFVEAMSTFFGRPAFLYTILLVIALWVTPNIWPRRFGVRRFDPPPFAWLELSLSLGSLLVTIGVLITQNREEKLAEQRAQLSLQVNLLPEQKIAKIIALLEELRGALPNVRNRYDPEAEVMTEPADPHAVMEVLEERLAEELAEIEKRNEP